MNRLCGSGLQAAVNAAQDICLRDAEIRYYFFWPTHCSIMTNSLLIYSIAASSESMSQAPFLLRNARFGVKFSQTPDLECSIWSTLTDHHINTPMGITAEK